MASSEQTAPSRWREWTELDPRIWRMAFARTVNTMGLSLAMTFLGIYIVETRGYPAWIYGVVALAANLAQSLANAWAGMLSDRIGRRPLITGSLFIRSGFIALLGTQIMFDAPLWTIALNMVVTSALRGCFEPVSYALVSDVCREDQRIPAFGLQRMGVNLGWAVGPALGGIMTLVVSYGVVFYVAALALIAAGVVTMRIEDPIRARPEIASEPILTAVSASIREPSLRLLLAATFLGALMVTQMYSTLSIYLTDELAVSKANVGLVYTLNGVGVLVLQLPAVALVRHLGIARVLPWASLVNACGFVLIGLGTGLPGAYVAMVVITSAEVVFAPAHQTAIAKVADAKHRGRTYGVVALAQTLGVAIAPLIGGILLDVFRGEHLAMWGAIAGFGIAQAWFFTRFVRRVSPAA